MRPKFIDSRRHVSINFAKIPFEDVLSSPARTLSPSYLGIHKNGWNIRGEVHEDYFEWVNDFHAFNVKTKQWVYGNFEGMVYASSIGALEEFMALYPYSEWDYWDI